MNSGDQKDWISWAALMRSSARVDRQIAKNLRTNGTADDMAMADEYEKEAAESERLAEQAVGLAKDGEQPGA